MQISLPISFSLPSHRTGVDLTVSSLIKDKELLSAIVDFHVAPNYALRPAQLTNNLQIPTLATDQLITVRGEIGTRGDRAVGLLFSSCSR